MIVTYPGVDGCATAALLWRHHSRRVREIRFQSQHSIAWAFEKLVDEPLKSRSEVHICGVGVAPAQEERLRTALEALADRSAPPKVVWWCGRQYNQPVPDWLAQVPGVALHSNGRFGTHTSFVSKSLFENAGARDKAAAERLVQLAKCDRRVRGEAPLEWTEKDRPVRESFEVLEAALTDFFKFGDTEAAPAAVEAIARGSYSASQKQRVKVFRRHGNRFKLQGRSSKTKAIKSLICKVARSTRPVSIHGETGVGKELVARLIHERSPRALEPFVAVNCATVGQDANMICSRLFGHVKGTFTGAGDTRPGLFVEAEGGTIFLDEVAELPLKAQAMLLRVLEEKAIQPLGTAAETPIDVRVVVATNEALPALVAEGRFREDLFYRLNILPISIPPLRERAHDIPQIAHHVAFELANEGGPLESPLTPDDLALLQEHRWPGNVRQLRNVLERSAALGISVAESLEMERLVEETIWGGRPRAVSEQSSPHSSPGTPSQDAAEDSGRPDEPRARADVPESWPAEETDDAETAKEETANEETMLVLDKTSGLALTIPGAADETMPELKALSRLYARAIVERVGEKQKAAKSLGISRTTLDKYLKTAKKAN